MEILADFGLFEVIGAGALLVVVRWIFLTKASSIAFLVVADIASGVLEHISTAAPAPGSYSRRTRGWRTPAAELSRSD